MSRGSGARCAAVVAILLLTAATAEAYTASESRSEAAAHSEAMAKIVVVGKQAQLPEMRDEMMRLEDEFFQRYNALNAQRDFDISCSLGARTGTLLETRSCDAQYALRVREDHGRDLLESMRGTSSPPAPAEMAILARRDEFRKNVLAVMPTKRKLAQIARECEDLQKRFDEVRRKLFGRAARRARETAR